MTDSHTSAPNPSPILALVALGIVHRLRPQWVRLPLKKAAQDTDVSPQRLSRLVSRVIGPFENALATLTRRGRPPAQPAADHDKTEIAILTELLGVATAILEHVPLRRRALRALLVGAYLRLKQGQGVTQQRFCDALAIPTRTLRDWVRTAAQAPCPPEPVTAADTQPRRRQRPPRRPRFTFNLLLPDTQYAADTTDLRVFDVPLKLIAAQDVGGRDLQLFDAIVVDDHESADLVVAVLTEALSDSDGAQLLTDQGTPYMAQATERALDALQVEHAPQVEGDPLGKATIERAFGVAKTIAAPILGLTNRLAQAIPALKQTRLAQAASRLLLTAILRAYIHGARAARTAVEQRSAVPIETLSQAATQHRQQARAEQHSKRLLLSDIHTLYDINRPLKPFIRSLKRYPLKVLQQAERAFRNQVHRDDIKNRAAYFAAIVRSLFEDWLKEQRAKELRRQHSQRQRQEFDQQQALHTRRHTHPDRWLAEALHALKDQATPSGSLLFGGAGAGIAWMHGALDLLVKRHGPTYASDIAIGVYSAFCRQHHEHMQPKTRAEIEAIFFKKLASIAGQDKRPCPPPKSPSILDLVGANERPSPPGRLRN